MTPCKLPAIKGGAVCNRHGGGAPHVRAAADQRLADLIPRAVAYYAWLLEQRDFPSAGLGAANAVWDREKGRPHESIALAVASAPEQLGDMELRARLETILAKLRDA